MRTLDLFAGIGGFPLAARWMKWETVAWCEWDTFCQRVLKYHFPNAEPHDDITKTDFTRYAGQIDVLTGGFPCQGFSSAGKRLGTEDDRYLWPEMLRAIREIQPRWVVGENVRGLTNWNGGLVFDEVQADLEAQGYEVLPFLLPACAVDAPHRRDRIWFIAYSKQVGCGQILHNIQKGEPGRGSVNATRYKWDASSADEAGLQERIQSGLRGVQYKETTFKRGESSRNNTANNWAEFPTQSPLCSRNDGFPAGLDGITFPKWREFSIGAYGNAIVPQVALQIFKAIQDYDQSLHHHPRSGDLRSATAKGCQNGRRIANDCGHVRH